MIPLVSLPLAASGSLVATRTLTRAMSLLMPTEETYAKEAPGNGSDREESRVAEPSMS